MSKNNQVTLEQAIEVARQYYRTGNLALAERTYQDILLAIPDHYISLYQLSLIAYQQQRVDEGLQFIQGASDSDPDQAEVWNLYGVLLEQSGKPEEAVEKWKKALKLDPEFVQSYSNLANCHWNMKRYDAAKEAAKKAIEIQPDYADAYINYGVAVNSLGDIEEAVKLWEKALELNPKHPNALINLGNAMRDLGQLKESEEYCRKALEILPNNTVALVNLGNTLLDQSFIKEAEDLYRKAIQLQPTYIEAHNNLSLVLIKQLRFDEAAAQARHALAFDPENLTALANLSVCLRETGQFKEAELSARKAIKLDPENAEAKIDLADILFLSDRLEEAEMLLNEVAEIMPDEPRLFIKLATVHERLNRFDEALVTLDKALELSPDMPEIYHKRGLVYLLYNKIEKSLEEFDKALEINPEFIQVLASKSEALQTNGDMEAALKVARKGLSINDAYPSLYYTLSKVKKFTEDDADLAKMKDLVQNANNRGNSQATSLYFALFKAHEDIKEYDKAFEYLKMANDKRRQNSPFDREGQNRSFSSIFKICKKDLATKLAGKGYDSNIPVFIVGMPRSGTTLTEQIISSHPDVFGAGELACLADVEGEHGFVNLENSSDMGKSYVEKIKAIHPDAAKAKRITDKMPANYLRLLQIRSSMPNAKIIHCRRNPMDTMLSCYKQLFARGQYWSYNFDEMAEYYAYYEKIMDHWREVFPGEFLEINYEETVSDFENQARKLIDYVGLEWNDACLKPHKQKRAILTASKGQVIKPIYKTSVEAWRRYEEQLQPLADKLEEHRQEIVV